jgi:hypothetical protein
MLRLAPSREDVVGMMTFRYEHFNRGTSSLARSEETRNILNVRTNRKRTMPPSGIESCLSLIWNLHRTHFQKKKTPSEYINKLFISL